MKRRHPEQRCCRFRYTGMKERELDRRLVNLSEVKHLTRIHRWEFMRFTGSEVNVELSTDFRMDSRRRTLTLRVGAHYSALRSQIWRQLLDYVVDAEFEINGESGLIEESEAGVIVTTDLLRLMLSITIGAMRGMIALRTANTFLAHFPLPIYDLEDLSAQIADVGHEVAYNEAAY